MGDRSRKPLSMAGLSPEQVNKQIDNMVQFIIREGQEKSDEIRMKAEEEFNIEKLRLIQSEKDKLTAAYDLKRKQAEIKKKIQQSNQIADSRRKLLQARDKAIQDVRSEARDELVKISQGGTYKQLLQDLLTQGFLSLGESEMKVQCRKEDESTVKGVLDAALSAYKAKSGATAKATIDTSKYLPPAPKAGSEGASCCGGVVISDSSGRISVANTLDSRLDIAYQQRLPEIRIALFGRSKTREHTT